MKDSSKTLQNITVIETKSRALKNTILSNVLLLQKEIFHGLRILYSYKEVLTEDTGIYEPTEVYSLLDILNMVEMLY